MKSRLIYIIFSLVLFTAGCSERREVPYGKEYVEWINDPANGLVQIKYINDVKVSLQYIPADFLAYQELQRDPNKYSKHIKDSLINYYSRNRSFILTIGPDDRKRNTSEPGNDIMLRDIEDMEDFKDRSMTMNFDMGEYVTLLTGDEKLKPVITNMENVYGLSAERKIHFVFASQNAKRSNTDSGFDFEFNDEIFNTGINHFVVSSDQLNKIPKLIF